MDPNVVSGAVVDAAMKVHSALGPGLMEGVYRRCLAHELRRRGLSVQEELHLPVVYDGVRIEMGYRIDLLVENAVVVETKSIARFSPVDDAQVLTYLRLSGVSIGLLMNFNVVHLRDGIKRLVHHAPDLVVPVRARRRGKFDLLRVPPRPPRLELSVDIAV